MEGSVGVGADGGFGDGGFVLCGGEKERQGGERGEGEEVPEAHGAGRLAQLRGIAGGGFFLWSGGPGVLGWRLVKKLNCFLLSVMASVAVGYGGEAGPLTVPEGGFLSGEEKGHPSLSFYFDNDLFAGSDEQYTNGGRLAWLSSNYRFENLPSEVRRLGKLARLDRKEGWMFNYGFSLTQLIFTPEDVDAKRLIRDDRPYAGWLGFGFSVHAKRADVVHSAELNLGMVGPAALGEEAQNGVHRMRGFAEAEGWDNQLSNEFAISFPCCNNVDTSAGVYEKATFASVSNELKSSSLNVSFNEVIFPKKVSL